MTFRSAPGRGAPPRPVGQDIKHSAARSHEQNDKYMNDFEKAWEELSIQQRSTYAQLEEPSLPTQPISRSNSRSISSSSPSHLINRAPSSLRIGEGQQRATVTPAIRGAVPLKNPSKDSVPVLPDTYPSRVEIGWLQGPVDAAGTLIDVSDRPNTCSAALWSKGEVVIGSTDHALYVIDTVKGVKKRTLYSKGSGHTEWVTCVTYCPDGRIVSGGMDSKLWLWPSGGTRGFAMEGHFGPISKVCYDNSSGLVASASYDKTVRLWELGARGHEVGVLQGHEAPVQEMGISAAGQIITGDRSGHILLWDTSAGGVSWRMKNVHQGHVTALSWFDVRADSSSPCGGCFVSGGQDGVVRVWDPRARSNLAKLDAHINARGRGAVSDIVAGGAAALGNIVTAGADGSVQVIDPRKSFAVLSSSQLTNFPYSLAVAGGVAVAGCGDGSVHFIDIKTGRSLYALGANRAAVRCLECRSDRLVCSGDDGKVVMYAFE